MGEGSRDHKTAQNNPRYHLRPRRLTAQAKKNMKKKKACRSIEKNVDERYIVTKDTPKYGAGCSTTKRERGALEHPWAQQPHTER